MSGDASVLARIERLRKGGAPRVLDLFSGCGGLSLGFHAQGFEIAASVEFDRDAAASHGANFHPGDPRHARARDITKLTPQQLAHELDLGPVDQAIDVLVGGPPCQAFARVGRSKLREIAEHPEAFRMDARARLYLEYLRYVEAFLPLALVMENVPDVLNHGGQNVAEETRLFLEELGYEARYTLLNAAFYGVPQMRERMILIAVRRELDVDIRFPEPTHHVELPPGYAGSRQVALKLLRSHDGAAPGYVPAALPHPGLEPAVTAMDAMGDLPPITAHLRGDIGRGARRFDELAAYPTRRNTDYATLMRGWPGFESAEGVWDHVIRYLPRDWKLFGRLLPGDQYPQAHAAAVRMFEEALADLKRRGKIVRTGSAEWEALRASIVPPYDTGKFPNKWRKMEPDLPARTLMAHLGKDSYSHIHYDSAQSRTISVREAARLQSFPDGFVFCGAMNAAFRQIGNAVPPLLARAVAGEIAAVFERAVGRNQRRPGRLAA
ncbi:DNA cytosine methyltransferase [Brevundimonas lutea]|uniref:DNA cytosine methyltransferase n=1 Tax=Brevundimonas lutea TaxID=2293980 RepID=UPI000F04303D|nr:DNA cytosine methyltransferase [Brevundimonas lutea]